MANALLLVTVTLRWDKSAKVVVNKAVNLNIFSAAGKLQDIFHFLLWQCP